VRLLLDTHALLWTLIEPERLADEALAAVTDPQNDVTVSVVSAWEISIKQAAGKLDAPDDLPSALAEQRFVPLPVTLSHALRAGRLPLHHTDPFDRLIIAQAGLEDLTIVMRDRAFRPYGVSLLAA
jgi:PIN domain nuclease of toxin-antitoxin system